ncbi:AMP-binding protein [Spirillospora sp. NPDC052242]
MAQDARTPADVAVGAARRMTLGEQLARAARLYPGKTAFVCEGDERTYAQTDERVTRLARALADRGVGRGDRVAVHMHNGLEVVEGYLAACRLGAIAVPVNFRLVADEVAHVLTDSGARALLVDAALAGLAAEVRPRAPELETVLATGGGERAPASAPNRTSGRSPKRATPRCTSTSTRTTRRS